MKGLKRTRWGAIALVIALVLASGLALTGCDFGLGSGPDRGFDPVGIWRGTYTETWHDSQGTIHMRGEFTLTLFANGTGTARSDWFHNNIFTGSSTSSISYSVSENNIIIMFENLPMTGVFTDRNTLQLLEPDLGIIIFTRN